MEYAQKFSESNLTEKTNQPLLIRQIVAPQEKYDSRGLQQIRFLNIPLLGVLKNCTVYAKLDIYDGDTDMPLTTATALTDEASKVVLAGLSTQCVRNIDILLNNQSYANATNLQHYWGMLADSMDDCDISKLDFYEQCKIPDQQYKDDYSFMTAANITNGVISSETLDDTSANILEVQLEKLARKKKMGYVSAK